MTVYDKAKWYFDAVHEMDLDQDNAFAPAAYFLAWAATKGLLSEERSRWLAEELEKFERREVDGVRLYQVLDGVLDSEVLSKDGDMFALSYFEYRTGLYLSDLRSLLPPNITEELALGWNWTVYAQLSKRMSQRYEQWKSGVLPDAL